MKLINFVTTWPKRKLALTLVGALLIAAVAGLVAMTQTKEDQTVPNYSTLTPPDRTVEDLGGWQRISPPDGEPVFAYNDEIDGVPINVSQQQLPESFQGNVSAEIKLLADSYSATTVIDTGETTAYIGRSARGPQSVIFTKNNLLVLIKSQNIIKNESWTQYISALSDPEASLLPTF